MLTTDDVKSLFAAMRTAYGGQWKHGNEALSVWRNAMSRFDAGQLERAMVSAMGYYVDHPPTLPQFLQILQPPEGRVIANTYLPPPRMPHANAVGNRVLMSVLLKAGGVESFTLTNLVGLKTALVYDFLRERSPEDNPKPTKEFVADINRQLTALAAGGAQ